MKNKITIICGATASGKSAVALKLAKEQNGVIINADSMQLYKDLRIITARPSIEEEQEIPHYLYGILEYDEISSAGKWVLQAKEIIDKTQSEGKLPIIVGGTGLYIKTLMKGISPIPDVSKKTKTTTVKMLNELGTDKFREELARVDKISTEKIKPNDKQRLMRAMEVYLETGKPISYWQKKEPEKFYNEKQFDLQIIDIDRAELYRRCDERFLKMLDNGGIDEIKELREKLPENYSSYPITRALGVKELFAYLDGEISLKEAVAKAQQSTRNYAKRQCTWFKNQL